MIIITEISKTPTLRLKALNNTNIIEHIIMYRDCCQIYRQLTHNVHINTGSDLTDHVQHNTERERERERICRQMGTKDSVV